MSEPEEPQWFPSGGGAHYCTTCPARMTGFPAYRASEAGAMMRHAIYCRWWAQQLTAAPGAGDQGEQP